MRAPTPLALALALAVALAACSDSTIGTENSPPAAAIIEPAPGSVAQQGDEVAFVGTVEDRRTPSAELEVWWTSSIDGELQAGLATADGDTGFSTGELAVGEHTVTLQVRDADGATGQATTTVTVLADQPPEIVIDSPEDGSAWPSELPVLLEATVSDDLDAADSLSVVWATAGGETLVADAQPDSAGATSDPVDLEPGAWTVEATATDSAGNTRTASVTFTVTPPNTAPTCEITAPQSLTSVASGVLVVFEGSVDDAEQASDTLSVSLSSSLDGHLGDLVPSSGGDVALGVATLATGAHTVTLDVDDGDGGTCADFIVLTVGDPPDVSITAPAASDALEAGVPFTASGTVSDADEPASGLAVGWSSDLEGALAAPVPDGDGLVSSELTLGAGVHTLTLTATDATGAPGADSVTVTVNAAPTAPVVDIDPSAPPTEDDLLAVLVALSSDADGPDALSYSYSWSVGGVPQPAFAPPDEVPASATGAGETWEVTVVAFDGVSSSPPVTASVTIDNTPPSITVVEIDPATAYTTTTLEAVTSGWSDPDGDAPEFEYLWFADGSPVGGDSVTLEGSEFVKGEVITVEATPVDASSAGTPQTSAGVPILNTPPGAPGVSILPTSPTDLDPLQCSVSTPSSDADGDLPTYDFSWTDGATTVPGATLAESYTAATDVWTCTATPDDGDDVGTPGSADVTINASSNCSSGGPSPNTCSPACDSPGACLNNWSTLDCAPPVVTAAYFTMCSSIPFTGATYCFVVEGEGFQLDYTTQNGNMKWGSQRQGGTSFNGSNWNWLYSDQLVVTVGSWYSSNIGAEFWILNPDGQRSDCVTIGWQ